MKKYNSKIYNPYLAFIYVSVFWIVFMGLSAFIAIELKTIILFPLCFVLSLTIPFFFQKKVKELFTKNVVVNFTTEDFSFILYDLKNDFIINKYQYKWSDICLLYTSPSPRD